MMNLQLPMPFSFANSEEWAKWKRWFEQYCQTSSLIDKAEERQVSTLLGEDAEEVLDTMQISAEDKKKYSKVIDEFDKHFTVKKNVIFEHARFNQHSQLADEPADYFITEIHKLAENCDFGAMKDELIRDRLVVGIKDSSLSEHLQLEPELTLDRAKWLIRQCESVQCQQELLKPTQVKLEKWWPGESFPDAVRQPSTKRKLPAIPTAQAKPSLNNCRGCGSGTHPRQSCPAKDAICFRCNRRGHYSSQCLCNTIANVTATPGQPLPEHIQQHEDIRYLDTIDNARGNVWEVHVKSG